MRFFSDRQRRTLRAVCDAIKPGEPSTEDCGAVSGHDSPYDGKDPFCLSATDLRIADLVEKALYERDDNKTRTRLKLLLDLLDRRFFNAFLSGTWKRFEKMTLDERTASLQGMATSRFNVLRGGFHDIKQMATFLAYAHFPPLADNPVWAKLDYPGQASNPRQKFELLPTIQIGRANHLDCEVLVVGSGAGGGVVAAELAAAGHDVLIVEKGKQFGNHDMPQTELTGMRELYEGKGVCKTVDRSMIVLAGSTLGGGTTVNWMTCLEPPQRLREQWASDFGFAGATSSAYSEAIKIVANRIGVTTDESPANGQNAILERGCKALDYRVDVIPRNVRGCVDCDFCGFGCRYGAKQDTRRTFLRDAVDSGARIAVRAMVNKITHSCGQVTGAQMSVVDANGRTREVTVRCKVVVSAAGAIHTPALLMRSGLTNPNIGRNLFLHPVGAVYARYADRVDSWIGPPQTRLCDQFADLDGLGYGFRIETSPAHPGLWGLGLPWFSGRQHRDLMRQLPYLGNLIVLTRDRYAGHIRLKKNGLPTIHYSIHPYDAQHLLHGIETGLRIQWAAGAKEIFGPHQDQTTFTGGSDQDFEAFVAHVRRLGTRPNHFGSFCAHQMSTARMASSARQGAMNPEGESHEIRNLYCADGSLLPTSTGVNPMITIMSTAYYIAQHVKANLSWRAGRVDAPTDRRRSSDSMTGKG